MSGRFVKGPDVIIVGASRNPSRERRRHSSDAGEPRRIRIVVTPFASQSMKSDVSRVWTCISARPGRRYLPVPSMTRQHTCAGRAPARATCTIRPPCTRTVWRGRTRAESIGTSDTFQMARTESQGCCTARPRTAISIRTMCHWIEGGRTRVAASSLGPMTSPIPVATTPALRRVIGVGGLAAAIFNITVGAAIFVLPAHMAASLGAAAPLAYLVCAVATALVALCIAEAGSRVPQSGGPYAYVGTARGPYSGVLCGVLLWLGITLAMGAVATVFADAVGGLQPGLGGPLPRAVLLIAIYGGLAVVNIRGAALGSQVSGIATVAKIVPLIAFVALGLPHVRAENLAPGSFPSLSRLGESGLLLMFAFFGMESALQASGEVLDAARAVPRAIALAVTGVGVLYIALPLVPPGRLRRRAPPPPAAQAPPPPAAGPIPRADRPQPLPLPQHVSALAL